MPEKSDKRLRRVADLIQRELALCIKKELNDPRLSSMTITAVVVSPDLSRAKIFFTLLNPADQSLAEKALKKAIGFLRHYLSQQTLLRYVPQLHFIYDVSIQQGADMIDLIQQAEKADRELKGED